MRLEAHAEILELLMHFCQENEILYTRILEPFRLKKMFKLCSWVAIHQHHPTRKEIRSRHSSDQLHLHSYHHIP